MKSTFSIILSLLLAISSTSSGFVGNNNPPIRVANSRLFEGEEEDTTTTPSNKPTSRRDFEFSFEVPKKGIGEYIIILDIIYYLSIFCVVNIYIFLYLHLTYLCSKTYCTLLFNHI